MALSWNKLASPCLNIGKDPLGHVYGGSVIQKQADLDSRLKLQLQVHPFLMSLLGLEVLKIMKVLLDLNFLFHCFPTQHLHPAGLMWGDLSQLPELAHSY